MLSKILQPLTPPSLFVGWGWGGGCSISIKEQVQQQPTLKELTSGWMKYVIEWDSVVNNGVGWDLIPICSFKE